MPSDKVKRNLDLRSVDSALEEKIVELNDELLSARQIALQLGAPTTLVKQVIRRYEQAAIEEWWFEAKRMEPALELAEAEAVEKILASMYPSRRRETLGSLLKSWNDIVAEVERPYIEDESYRNDLDKRRSLERIMQASPVSLQRKLHDVIDPLDQRFKEVTQTLDAPLGGFLKSDGTRVPHASIQWWYFRIPKETIPAEDG